MTMLATREFGPKGIGWGVDILEERFDNGAPITRTVKGRREQYVGAYSRRHWRLPHRETSRD